MGFKKIRFVAIPRKGEKKKYSRFRKIQRFKRDRMEIQEKGYVHSFVIWNPSIFFLSRCETSFDSCIFSSCSFFQQTFGGLWNSSLHHEKCKVDFHAANTRGIPIDLFSLPSFFFSFIFILFFLFFIRFPWVASWQKKTRGVPPPQVACKNAEWRREFFRSSRRYPDPGRNVREVRYGNRGCLLSTRNSLVSNVHCRFSLKDIRGLDARCQDVIPYFPVSTVSFFHVGFLLHNWTCSFIEIHESMVLLVFMIFFLKKSRNLCYRICEIEMIVDALIKRRILIFLF